MRNVFFVSVGKSVNYNHYIQCLPPVKTSENDDPSRCLWKKDNWRSNFAYKPSGLQTLFLAGPVNLKQAFKQKQPPHGQIVPQILTIHDCQANLIVDYRLTSSTILTGDKLINLPLFSFFHLYCLI